MITLAVQATTVSPVTVQELLQESEIAVPGRIELSQVVPGDCGVRYVVHVQETFKGSAKKGSRLLFSSKKALTTGSRYFLFLNKEESRFDPISSTNSLGPKPDPRRVQMCKRNRPRYTVNVWGNGAFKVTGTMLSDTPVVTFNDSMVHMPKSLKPWRMDQTFRYDVDRDQGAVDAGDLKRLLKRLQAPKQAPNNSSKPTPLRGAA
jgi:hypothetical protein